MHSQIHLLRDLSPEETSVRLFEDVLMKGHPCALAWSSGKDSSVAANLLFTAAIRCAAKGVHTPVVVTHSDTGVENPEIHALALSEIKKMEAFAAKHGLGNFSVMVGQPRLSDSFAVRVIGGRAMPAYPDTRQDCTMDWKIQVQDSMRREVFARMAKLGHLPPVVCTGVRRGESGKRDAAIEDRGEVGGGLWANEKGELRLSPILAWDVDDVWEYIGMCNAGVIESYSDFSDVMRVYRDAGSSSCVVVADMKMVGHSKPCSSRFGCWACTMVRNDRSMRQMIESDPVRYGSMRPLADLRDFLARTQYDWERRNFVGRTINDGMIRIAADGFSPRMLEDLLWYALSIQMATGHEIVSQRQLVAIDARWSLYGLHPPFHALRIAQLVSEGERRFPPVVPDFPKTPAPDYGWIRVGVDWDGDLNAETLDAPWSDETARWLAPRGLRDPLLELASECGVRMRSIGNGRTVLDLESESEVANDQDVADFLEFIAPDMIADYEGYTGPWTQGYHVYNRYGTVVPGKGQTSRVDAILRRTEWRQRHGLHGHVPLATLLSKLDVRHMLQQDLTFA